MDRFGSVHNVYISSVCWLDVGYLWFSVVNCDDDQGPRGFIQFSLVYFTSRWNQSFIHVSLSVNDFAEEVILLALLFDASEATNWQIWTTEKVILMERKHADIHSQILPQSSNIIFEWRLADYFLLDVTQSCISLFTLFSLYDAWLAMRATWNWKQHENNMKTYNMIWVKDTGRWASPRTIGMNWSSSWAHDLVQNNAKSA